jgi:hypothetical protein
MLVALDSKEDMIRELSRAKLSLQEKSAASAAKDAELLSKDKELVRLKEAMKTINLLSQ